MAKLVGAPPQLPPYRASTVRFIAAASVGTTAVTKTLTATYNVVAPVTKTLAPSYFVKLAIPKTVTTSYNVIGRITKTLTPSYNVIQRISKTLSASYSLLAVPVNTVAPVISGSPLSGQLLTVSTGTWNNTPTGYTYQWQVEDSPGSGTYSDISGETANTLQL